MTIALHLSDNNLFDIDILISSTICNYYVNKLKYNSSIQWMGYLLVDKK